MRSSNGLFISIDGPSGVGKSSTARTLAGRLRAQGRPVHLTSEPSNGPIGELACELTETLRGIALACLYAADRYYHLATEVRPHLDAGDVVITDRYTPSALVMQQVADRKPNLRSSIYRSDADGRWHGWVTMGTKEDGSLDRRHRTGATQAVTRKVQALERQRDGGTPGKPGRPLTVAAWLDTWLTTIAPRTVAQSTLDSSYQPKVRRWIIPQLGKHRLDRLEPEHLDAFYAWLATQHLKPNTILQIHRILSRALKIAWKRGKTGRNVAAMVDAPVGEEIEIEPLTRDEARQILAAVKDTPNGARWSVALGARHPPERGARAALAVRRSRRRHDRGWLAAQAGQIPARLRRPCRMHRRPPPQALPTEMQEA